MIQIGIGRVGIVAIGGRVEAAVQFIAVEIGAAIDGNGVIRRVPDQEPAPVKRVVKRSRLGMPAQVIGSVDGKYAADLRIQACSTESSVASEEQARHDEKDGEA